MRLGSFGWLGRALAAGMLLLLLLGAASPTLLGFPLWRVGSALSVSTALTAKLACSSFFLSGFDAERNRQDAASYSPVNAWVSVRYLEDGVEANLWGLSSRTARYIPGVGCTLEPSPPGPSHRLAAVHTSPSSEPWPKGPPSQSMDPLWQQQLQSLMAQDSAAGRDTRALLWLQQGQLRAEVYASGVTATTPLMSWSMGKSLTAVLQGRAEALGYSERSDSALFETWQQDERRGIRMEDLLQMVSGLAFEEVYAPGSDAAKMLFEAPSAAAVALEQPLARPSGSHFAYSSGTTNLIAQWLSERLGGPESFQRFLHQQLLSPLGMRHTYMEPDPSGVPVGSSYVYASGRDWARLALLLLNGGSYAGEPLLSPSWVAHATQPNGSQNERAYGYQLWLNHGDEQLRWPALPADAYAMMGNRKQVVMVIPSRQAIFVRLGWSEGSYPMEQHVAALLAYDTSLVMR
ncbi:serine hydrolase domain-containing protein [Ferrimonas marina]|uniref:Beta-lactamase n=1 Tax=Ferrimonas marina TaxID=299255 RepID=A0A1M5NZU8_9GAMM|nr:serine hydrolase [Ferrimonas marina]SHG95018.1 Beta-lactamase [Ferrimonas marina]